MIPDGTIVGEKYRVKRRIGLGAMAEVYEVEHLDLLTSFALKVALPEIADDAELSRRFENEARAAARLRSPHIARVVDVGRVTGRPYIVMELLEGEDLDALAQRVRALPVSEVCDYVIQALAALEVAHGAGVVHRDLKPANLFRDGKGVIKLVDFGVSTPLNTDNRITQTGRMLGSPAYMSPEQLRSAKHVDGRADLWSIGVILYELLTGVMPFAGRTMGGVFAAILESTPAAPSAHAPGIPPELDAIILRCLQRDPSDRFQVAGELAQALAPFASEVGRVLARSLDRPSISVPPTAVPTSPPPSQRSIPPWAETKKSVVGATRRAGLFALAAVVALLLTATMAWKLGQRSVASAPPQVLEEQPRAAGATPPPLVTAPPIVTAPTGVTAPLRASHANDAGVRVKPADDDPVFRRR